MDEKDQQRDDRAAGTAGGEDNSTKISVAERLDESAGRTDGDTARQAESETESDRTKLDRDRVQRILEHKPSSDRSGFGRWDFLSGIPDSRDTSPIEPNSRRLETSSSGSSGGRVEHEVDEETETERTT